MFKSALRVLAILSMPNQTNSSLREQGRRVNTIAFFLTFSPARAGQKSERKRATGQLVELSLLIGIILSDNGGQ